MNGSVSKFIFPVIKSVYPSDLISDIVNVQPMTQPSGNVFYIDILLGYVAIIFDEELWLEDDGRGGLYCPQTRNDRFISDHEWYRQLEEWLVIPKWEIEYEMGGYRNEEMMT
jgi:hypothetical protein